MARTVRHPEGFAVTGRPYTDIRLTIALHAVPVHMRGRVTTDTKHRQIFAPLGGEFVVAEDSRRMPGCERPRRITFRYREANPVASYLPDTDAPPPCRNRDTANEKHKLRLEKRNLANKIVTASSDFCP